MGWRFFDRVTLVKGVTLNLSKRGASTSVGPRGARVTVGHGSIRGTVGAPGTGLSYTKQRRLSKPVQDGIDIAVGILFLAGLMFLFWIFARLH